MEDGLLCSEDCIITDLVVFRDPVNGSTCYAHGHGNPCLLATFTTQTHMREIQFSDDTAQQLPQARGRNIRHFQVLV